MISRRAAQSMLPSSKPLPQRGRRAAVIPSGAKCLRALRIGFEGKDPAPGYRDAMSTRGFGGLRAVGGDGYSWSSSVAETNAYYLNFHYSVVRPQDGYSRAYGFQLRCLQE